MTNIEVKIGAIGQAQTFNAAGQTVAEAVNKRKLVTARVINAVDPIVGADAIEVVTVDGWKVVVKKGEFKVGDPCVYCEIDSFLPAGNPAWQFLVDKSPRTFEGTVGHRLRTIKLRGQVSQGFVMPLGALPSVSYVLASDDAAREFYLEKMVEAHTDEGYAQEMFEAQKAEADFLRTGLYDIEALLSPQDLDFTKLLGVKKYEQPLPACLVGQAEGLFPSFIQKTDQERCQNLGTYIFGYEDQKSYVGEWLSVRTSPPAEGQLVLVVGDDGYTWECEWPGVVLGGLQWKPVYVREAKASLEDEYEITLKLDGSSMTTFVRGVQVVLDDELNVPVYAPETGVCSRNLQLKVNEENKDNTFIKVSTDTGLLDALKKFYVDTGRSIAVQGEVMAPGIQGNRENFKEPRFFVFDVFDIDKHEYMSPEERMEVFKELQIVATGIEHVPVLHKAVRLQDLGLTSVKDLLKFAEGPSMVNPVCEGKVFKCRNRKFSFKAINDVFLTKEKD